VNALEERVVGYTLSHIRSEKATAYPAPSRGRHPLQFGFTLIEVLVVLAILGIVAAVVVLSISGLTGRGAVAAANTEAHQVQSAVIACMQQEDLGPSEFTLCGDSDQSRSVEQYLLNAGRLQARYVISGGRIVDAYAYADGRWSDLIWDTDTYEWGRSE
jgi:prepilin-type N-terminal cleavage/methylation domain-containing protein